MNKLCVEEMDAIWTHLYVIQALAHVVQAHGLSYGRLDAVNVWGEKVGSPEAIPAHAGRPSLQTQDLTSQSPAAVRSEPVVVLAAGPRLLLVGRWRLVYGVDIKGVAEVGVGVAGLCVRQGLVGRREVGWLEIRAGRVREGRSRTVEVLTDRGQVG